MAIPTHLIQVGDIWYANVRVPSDIVESYGKANVRRSLKTKDEKEAGRRRSAKVAEIEREFADHRAKLKTLAVAAEAPKPAPTPQSFADLGRQHGRDIAERELIISADLYEEAAGNPTKFWRSLPEGPFTTTLIAEGDLDRAVGYVIRSRARERIALLRRMIANADFGEMLALARDRCPGLDRKGSLLLAASLARAEIEALQSSLAGELDVHLKQAEPSAPNPVSTTPALPPISLDSLFDKWRAETKPSASTYSTWRGIVKSLKEAFPDKADDAGALSPEDLIKWKDDLVAIPLTAKTINASYLACIRTLFNYGVTNKLVTTNPGVGVKAAGGRKGATGKLPYTNDEVVRLLELARKEATPAKRWLPWLAAQTGSRIGEVAQLQGSYVKEEDGIHYLDIKAAPDAGSIKEEVSERIVPLHPQLIADGFLEFVKSRGNGPLFYRKSSGDPMKKHASKGVSNHLAAWIRENGFRDPRKAPNHALRHWFKTHAAAVGIQDRMVDKLQGHAPRSEADKYYHPELGEKLEALRRIKLPPVAATALNIEGEA